MLAATDAACGEALARSGRPAAARACSPSTASPGAACSATPGIEREVERIAGHAGGPVAGFYTYGEIARTHGVNGFHNQTLVVLALA